jgi:tetratricopeptide (TPR) repeat protein
MAVVKKALPYGNPGQLLQLGRQLIAAKNGAGALEVLQFSYDNNPNQFIALVGMDRAHSARGEYAKAAEFAAKALHVGTQ